MPGHYQYRSQGAVGIADTSIFAPSPQGNLRKLGFSDSFMVCSCLLYPLRFTSSLSESRLLRRRHGSCSKLQALSFAKSRQTSSTSFSVGQAPPRAVFVGIGKSQYRPIGEMTRISRIILGSTYTAGPWGWVRRKELDYLVLFCTTERGLSEMTHPVSKHRVPVNYTNKFDGRVKCHECQLPELVARW